MADVRHANYDSKSCARVTGVKQQQQQQQQQQSAQVRSLPPPGSMSSSPASLDVDVNSLSTTSSTASSCLPLVPSSTDRRCVISLKKGAGSQSRGTSNDKVIRSAAVSGPGSIITYIDCNSQPQSHQQQQQRRHQSTSFADEDADDGDDEGEDDQVASSSKSASCLQVRRGSEPVLNAVHRFQSDEQELLTTNCDNSKRWSTAIAVDSSARNGCCTQSERSTESLSEDLLVDHLDEGTDEAKGSSISPRSAKEEGYASEEKSSDPSANTPSSTTSNLTFSRFQRDSGRQSMLANNIGSWVEAADRQLIRMKNEANCQQSEQHSSHADQSHTKQSQQQQQQQNSSQHEHQEQHDLRNQATGTKSPHSSSSSDSSSSSTSASSSPAPPPQPSDGLADDSRSGRKHEKHKIRKEIESRINACDRNGRKGDPHCRDFENGDDDDDDEEEGEDEDDATDAHGTSHRVRQELLDQTDKRTFVRPNPSAVILSVKAGSGPLGIHVVPYSDPNRSGFSNGMLIEKIEPGGRIDADGRFDIDDWIIEVNGESLLCCDFKEAEEIFKEALKLSPEVNLKVIKKRSLSNGSMQTPESTTTAATPSSSASLSASCVTTVTSASSTTAMNQCSKKSQPPSVMPKPPVSRVMAAESAASGLIEIEERSSRRVAAKSATITSTKKITASSATTNAAAASSTPVKSSGGKTGKGSSSITPAAPAAASSGGALVSANTRKIGKKYHIRLQKRANGLGFSITTRDNPAGGNCPIYIKNILPKGSAIFDGRLKQGDRLLEVNGVEMTGKSQEEAVQLLKSIAVGSQVDMIVSRQEPFPLDPLPSPKVPRQIPPEKAGDVPIGPEKQREVLTFEIPLNDTGSAGLGVSVKGKTCTSSDGDTTDLGIFVKNVIHGGAASKDGRLKQNDQLISINGVHLLGLSNAEAMETLRRGMVSPDIGPDATPGVIKLTITRRVSASSVLHQGDMESSGEAEDEKYCDDDDYGDDDETCCYNEEEVFTRDGFGRQSMSEKRHAHLDAKNTDTYQKTKKVREGKQSTRSSSLEKGTPGRSSLGHRRVKSSVTAPKENSVHDLTTTTPKENKSIAQLADTPSRAKALFSPACCWSCQSPGSCSCRSHPAARSQPKTQTPAAQQQQSRTNETPIRIRSRSTGPTTSGTGIRKSSSLENLESMMQDLQKLHLEASGGMRPATMRVSRSRAKNESFRAAVDRSYDGPRNMLHPDQEGDIMETVDEGSESGSSVGQQPHTANRMTHVNHRSGYGMHAAAGGLNMGCFSASSQRPSAAGISLASQTTGFSTITGTTTTTATSTGTSTDDDHALIRGRNQRDSKLRDGKDVTSKQKRGILNKLFKFGSKKEKKNSLTSVHDADSDPEQVHARRQALSEQERIQEHVRRMQEQQDLIRHKHLQQQISQQQLMHDSLLDDSDKYGHYMNHHQIQEQMRNLSVPVAYSNRPVPRRSNPHPPPPLPPGRPQMQSSVRMRPHVTSPTTVIDARGAAISRERPLSNYYDYDSSSVLPANPSAITPNAIYEQRLIHHHQILQQQQEAAHRTAQLRQQMLKQQLHEAALYQQQQQQQQQVQSASAMARLQSAGDLYGVMSPEAVGHRTTDPNLFRRQLSNHRIVPASQPIATRVRLPVYQDQNVYVYSNPPTATGYSDHPIYGTRAAAAGSTPVSQSSASIYGSYYGPAKPPPPPLHPSHPSLQHLQPKMHHQGQSIYGPATHHVNPVTGSNV